jgi:hypothetical protein
MGSVVTQENIYVGTNSEVRLLSAANESVDYDSFQAQFWTNVNSYIRRLAQSIGSTIKKTWV